ncbi:hypothetical protein N5H17_004505, partial [Escherichia coli]|nr:hypothetical protein [Escherichia coli]
MVRNGKSTAGHQR